MKTNLKTIARSIRILPALVVAGSALVGSAESAPPPTPFSGVVLWQQAGAPAQLAAAGRVDPLDAASAPLRADTPMPIASITKLFTSVLVMQQVAAGTWRLDSTVGEIWPELGDAAVRALMLKQLLQHSSGLPNLDEALPERDNMAGYYLQQNVGAADLQVEATKLAHGPLASAPGTKFSYNNLDYLLLGALLERATGQPYAALLATRITGPLGMASTWMEGESGRPLHAACAVTEAGRLVTPPPVRLETFGPAGGAISTVRDLSTFAAALLGERLLPAAQRAALFKAEPSLGYVALGVWHYDFAAKAGKVEAIERQGDIAGWKATLILLPQRRAWLVLLSNTDAPDLMSWNPASASHRLLDALIGGAALPAAMHSAGLQGTTAAPQRLPRDAGAH